MAIYLWVSSKTKEARKKLEKLGNNKGKELLKRFLDSELKNKFTKISSVQTAIATAENDSSIYEFAELLFEGDNKNLFKEAVKNQAESTGTKKKGLFNTLIYQNGSLNMENLNKSKIKAFLLAKDDADSIIDDVDVIDEDDKRSHRMKNESILEKLKSRRFSNILKVFMAFVLWDFILIKEKRDKAEEDKKKQNPKSETNKDESRSKPQLPKPNAHSESKPNLAIKKVEPSQPPTAISKAVVVSKPQSEIENMSKPPQPKPDAHSESKPNLAAIKVEPSQTPTAISKAVVASKLQSETHKDENVSKPQQPKPEVSLAPISSPQTVLTRFQQITKGFFAVKMINAKEISVQVLSDPSNHESSPVGDGAMSFYGVQKYSAIKRRYLCQIIVQLRIDKDLGKTLGAQPIIADHIFESAKFFPNSLKLGQTTLLLDKSSIKSDKERRIGVCCEGDFAYIVNIYDATFQVEPPLTNLSRAQGGDAQLDRVCSDLKIKIVNKLGEGSTGVVYDCGGSVLKVIKSNVDITYGMAERQGVELIEDIIIRSYERDFGFTTERLKAALCDPHFIGIVSDNWKSLFGFVLMRKLDKKLADVLFSGIKEGSAGVSINHNALKRAILSIGKALGALHEHGVAHLDIKPDNIGLKDGSGGSLRASRCEPVYALFDFGTASLSMSSRLGNRRLTADEFLYNALQKGLTVEEFGDLILKVVEQLQGSPIYMAPEIVRIKRNRQEGFHCQQILFMVYASILEKINASGLSVTNSDYSQLRVIIEGEIKDSERAAFAWLSNLLLIGRSADIYSFGATIVEKVFESLKISSSVLNLESFESKLINNPDFKDICSTPEMQNLHDLLGGMLDPDPNKRPDIFQVLKHPYLQ